MELFKNSKKEHLTGIIEYFIDQALERYGNSLDDIADELYCAGLTRDEALDVLNKRYLNRYDWEEKIAPTEKVNTETGEGIFWKEYTEDEDIDVGDSDQAILETALTQIGIPYICKKIDGGGSIKIEIKTFDEGEQFIDEEVAAKVYFTKDGKFDGIY